MRRSRDQKLLLIARLADSLLAARTGRKEAVAAFIEARREAPALQRLEVRQLLEKVELELPRLGDLVNPPKPKGRLELMRDAVTALDAINGEYRAANAELERKNALLDRAASRDALTGVANRRAFTARIAQLAEDGPVSLVLFDLDHFKTVNDTHGHEAGDDVLVGVCRRLEEVLRDDELLARVGGEEFAVLVPHDLQAAKARAEALRAHLAAAPIRCRRGLSLAVTGSFGGVTGDADPDDLYRAADAAMYASKRAGRDCVSWAS